jgi:SAM-dependent methyltransferase
MVNTTPRLMSAAAERNKQPILDVLRRVLPASGTVLEIASGTGQHAAHFAAALPQHVWQPTDSDPELLDAIREQVELRSLPNLNAPLRLDVRQRPWPVERADAILCINMIHIAPWAATEELCRGASEALADGAPLLLYGPFRVAQRPTAPSNEAFDASLRARDREWGLRDLEAVAATAAGYGFALEEIVEMPANNLIVVFRRTASGGGSELSGDPA